MTERSPLQKSTLEENILRLIKQEWGRYSDTYFAELLAGKISLETAQENILGFEFDFELDGDSWCAHYFNFINLQECPAGFGKTKLEAAANFYREIA